MVHLILHETIPTQALTQKNKAVLFLGTILVPLSKREDTTVPHVQRCIIFQNSTPRVLYIFSVSAVHVKIGLSSHTFIMHKLSLICVHENRISSMSMRLDYRSAMVPPGFVCWCQDISVYFADNDNISLSANISPCPKP